MEVLSCARDYSRGQEMAIVRRVRARRVAGERRGRSGQSTDGLPLSVAFPFKHESDCGIITITANPASTSDPNHCVGRLPTVAGRAGRVCRAPIGRGGTL